ncbi:hypothetical protein FRC00_009463 [Tulasnella sp. 408]|nr:hypothetical protein FRC00_009463 [Tulasnella sp. 408]
MSSRIVLNLRTFRQGPSDPTSLTTDHAFELGALSVTQPTRRSAFPGTYLSAQRDPAARSNWSQSAPSSAWPLNDSKGGDDNSQLQPSSITVTIQMDVHRDVQVDEVDGDESADDSRWRGDEKKGVEDNLFQIPTRRLRESQYFSDMMDGSHIGSEGEGKSDENPICLGGVTAFEMESFLDALDARFWSGDPKLEFKQWAAALHLSTMWNFEELRKDIITHVNKTISNASPLDRIDASLKCKVEEWLHPAYQVLCERQTGLTDEEAQHLGLGRTVAIWRIREIRRPTFLKCWSCNVEQCYNCEAYFDQNRQQRGAQASRNVIELIKKEDVLKFE